MKSINSVAWSPNGHWIACSGDEDRVEVWDWRLETVVQSLPAKKKGIRSLSWSPDSRLLACAQGFWQEHDRGHVQVCKVAGGEVWAAREPFHGAYSVSFDASGEWLVSGHGFGMVNIWHAESGQKYRTIAVGHDITRLINGVCFSPDSKKIAFGSCYEDKLYIYDFDGSNRQEFNHPRSWSWRNFEHSIRFSPNNDWLARGSQNGYVRLWSTRNPASSLDLAGHKLATIAIAWSPEGRFLASGSRDGQIKVWDITRQNELCCMTHRPIHSICYSPDGHFLASAGDDHSIRIWDIDPNSVRFGQCLKILK